MSSHTFDIIVAFWFGGFFLAFLGMLLHLWKDTIEKASQGLRFFLVSTIIITVALTTAYMARAFFFVS